MEKQITLTSSEDIALVTLQNEARANTIDKVFRDELLEVLEEIDTATRFQAVILQAKGPIFSAGGDLNQILDSVRNADGFLDSLIRALNATILAIRRLPIPVVASIQGAAAGAGFSLAMACDFIVASRAARFVVGYSKLGTSTDGGLSFHLSRRLGAARALDLLLTRDFLIAEDAALLGLVQRVAEPDSLDETALTLARKLTDIPPAALKETKALVEMAAENSLERQLDEERRAFLRCASTGEFVRRVEGFVARSGRSAD
ncbi:enoyl-CoA hydratase/isomerase family protein [Paraburkholderia terrae]